MLSEDVALDAKAEMPTHSKGDTFLSPVTLQATEERFQEKKVSAPFPRAQVASCSHRHIFLFFHSWDLNVYLPSRLKCQS